MLITATSDADAKHIYNAYLFNIP